MTKNDVKSGVSVPEKFKSTSARTNGITSQHSAQSHTKDKTTSPEGKKFFANCAVRFERAGFALVRTDWRDGPIQYYVARHGIAHGPYGLAELSAMLWVIGDPK